MREAFFSPLKTGNFGKHGEDPDEMSHYEAPLYQ